MEKKATGPKHITETTLTLEKRILLHLLRLYGHRGDYEVPIDMSQEGVGRIFGVRQSSVSRVINKMLKDSLVEQRPAYVSGSKQKRKVYFLTHKGYQYSVDIKKLLEGRMITLLIDNEPRDIELRHVNEHLKTPMNILDILQNLGPRGELDISTLVKMKPRTVKAQIIFGDPLPKGRTFVGRRREINRLERWLSSNTIKVVCIHGVAGIGKTALMTHYIDKVKDKDVFYYRSREWSTLSNLLGSLGTFLSKLGRRGLASKIRTDGVVDLKEIVSTLESEIRDLDTLLVFDDFHTFGPSVIPLFSELLEILPRTKAQTVILSRYAQSFYDRRHVVLKRVVKEMRLGGLTKKDCDTILKDKQLDKVTVDHIYDVTGGHPLSLELIGVLGDLKVVDKFVFEEIFSVLIAEEKRVLQLMSIARYPLPMDVLLKVGSSEIVDELVKKVMLIEVGEGFEIQELLREFFLQRIASKVKSDLHSLILEYYQAQEGPKVMIETAYHMFYSGRKDEAIDLLLSWADQLVEEGKAEEMISLIDTFGNEIPKLKYRAAYNLREKAANIWGTWDNYLEYIFEVLFFQNLLPFQLKKPTRELRTSFLGRSAEDTDEALRDLESSMVVLEKVGDIHGIGHTLYTMVWIHWIRGEYSKARRIAITLLDKDIDDDLKGRTLMLLGGIDLETGDFDGSRSWFMKAHRIFTKMKSANGRVQTSVFEVSARLISLIKDRKRTKLDRKALNALKKTLISSIDEAKENYLPRAMCYCILRLAQLLILLEGKEDLKDALEGSSKVIITFDTLNDALGKALARATLALGLLGDGGSVLTATENIKLAQAEMDRACLDRMSGLLYLHLEKIYSATGDTFSAEESKRAAERLGVVPRKR